MLIWKGSILSFPVFGGSDYGLIDGGYEVEPSTNFAFLEFEFLRKWVEFFLDKFRHGGNVYAVEISARKNARLAKGFGVYNEMVGYAYLLTIIGSGARENRKDKYNASELALHFGIALYDGGDNQTLKFIGQVFGFGCRLNEHLHWFGIIRFAAEGDCGGRNNKTALFGSAYTVSVSNTRYITVLTVNDITLKSGLGAGRCGCG
jgi:hypothetical protein